MPTVRTAAVLMLLFTDLHYRSCALRTGNPAWPGPRGRLGVVAASIPALDLETVGTPGAETGRGGPPRLPRRAWRSRRTPPPLA